MTIKIDQRFTNFTTATPEYPFGAAKNETIPRQSNDGTTVQAVFINDNYGYICAVLAEAGIEPSNQPDNALVSDVLKAQKTIFMPQLIDGGDWSNVAGSQITRLNSRQFWLFEGESYVVSPSVVNFPITAPDDPTTQPSIYIKARFVTRSEFEVYQDKVSSELSSIRNEYLPKTGGTIKADNPNLKIHTNNKNDGVAEIEIGQDNYRSGYMSYDAKTDFFEVGTYNRSNASKLPIFKSYYSSEYVDFSKTIQQAGKTVATREYADTKAQAALESANEYTDEQAAIIVKKAVPVGSLVDFAIEKDREGYLRCDGSAYPITSYPELGAELGDFFNKNFDPVSVFRVPTMPIETKGEAGGSVRLGVINNDSFGNLYGITSYTDNEKAYIAMVNLEDPNNRSNIYIYDTNNPSQLVQKQNYPDFNGFRGIAAFKSGGQNFFAVAYDRGFNYASEAGIYIFNTNNLSSSVYFFKKSNFLYHYNVSAYERNNEAYIAICDEGVDYRQGDDGVYVYKYPNFSNPEITISNSLFKIPRGVAFFKKNDSEYLAVVDAGSDFSVGTSGVFMYRFENFGSPESTIINNEFVQANSIDSFSLGDDVYLVICDNLRIYIYDVNDLSSPHQTIRDISTGMYFGITAYNIDGVQYLTAINYATPVQAIIYALDSNRQFQIVPYIKA